MPDMDFLTPLKKRLARLDTAITITIASPTADLPAARATHELLEQLLEDASTVSLAWDAVDAESVIVTLRRGSEVGPVSFWGTPSGFELEGLTYALECLGGLVQPKIPDDERRVLDQIQESIAADLYVAPT